jgi:NIMA (never in mitosis gene a)-related kinase
MNLSDKEKENALNEIRILASTKNPNIVQYKEAFFDDETN